MAVLTTTERHVIALLAQPPRRQAFGLLDNSVLLKHTCGGSCTTVQEKHLQQREQICSEGRVADYVFLAVLADDLSKVSDSLLLHPGIQAGLLQSAWVACQMREEPAGSLGLEGSD